LKRRDGLPAKVSLETLEIMRPLFDPKKYAPEYFSYPVGIEIEVEGYKANNLRPFLLWDFKVDGSLRNGGIEGFSRPLHSAEEVGLALGEFEKNFLGKVPDLDFSWRTGIHVHICPLPFTVKDIVNCFLICAAVEPLLFKVFADQRRNSIFCVPLMDSPECKEVVTELIKAVDEDRDIDWVNHIVGWWPIQKKYASINFFRLKDIGTIEFRHLPGLNNFELLKEWISTISRILQYAEKTDYTVLKKKIMEMNTNSQYFVFIEEIFKNLSGKFLIPGFEKYLEEGVKKAKTFFLKRKISLKVTKAGSLFEYSNALTEKKRERVKKYI
jgi:hypothetical protein